ncbi:MULTISPECIES: serine protease [unclassified Kitasatospora]|uniref:serine protease n=1 Tax=Kitasatospora sp. MY 5-36 TaxID=1678027 RepID=UPI000B04310C|nr:serine protease [Kitasatospora sp. MY 5-36]
MARAVAVLAAAAGLVAAQACPAAAVIGGTPVAFGQIPYEVVLQNPDGGLDCGATIIDQTHVVTAAHCLDPLVLTGYSIRYGSLDDTSGGTVVPVDRVIDHPAYNPLFPHENDIALLELAAPIQYGADAQPVTLPAQGSDAAPGSQDTVSGWGITTTRATNTVLESLTVPVVSRDTCRAKYGSTGQFIFASSLCAGGANVTCQGDGGDPLTSNGTLVGIASWGAPCGQSGYPDVFTRVGSYVDWIRANSG